LYVGRCCRFFLKVPSNVVLRWMLWAAENVGRRFASSVCPVPERHPSVSSQSNGAKQRHYNQDRFRVAQFCICIVERGVGPCWLPSRLGELKPMTVRGLPVAADSSAHSVLFTVTAVAWAGCSCMLWHPGSGACKSDADDVMESPLHRNSDPTIWNQR